MPGPTLTVVAKVWLYPGPGGWHFLTLPKRAAGRIQAMAGGMRRGWGSVRVVAMIGATRWKTSVFPDKRSNSFLLPIKKEVRVAEGIEPGDRVRVSLVLER